MVGVKQKTIATDNRGSVLLEFVIASMLLLVLWAGMCNTALILKDRLAVAAVARDAGREAAVTGSNHNGVLKGQEIARANGIDSRASISVRPAGDSYITSEVSCRSPLAFPGMGALFGGKPWDKEITLKTAKTFRLEQ